MKWIIISTQLLLFVVGSAWAGGPEKGQQVGRRPGNHRDGNNRDENRRDENRRDVFPRRVTFNLFCSYGEAPKKCYAGARFEKTITLYGEEIEDDSNYPNNPIFEVECAGDKIFNDGARRFTDREGTRIQAQSGPFPAVLIPAGSLQEGRRRVKAQLELRDETLHGSCFIYTGEP